MSYDSWLLAVELSWPTSANTNGWAVPKERKSPAVGLWPASYATVHVPPEPPVAFFSSLESDESLILCQPLGTLKYVLVLELAT